MSNNKPDLEFLMGVVEGVDEDAIISKLRAKAGDSFEVVKRFRLNPIYQVRTSEDGFESMTGVKPTYSEEGGWLFDPSQVDTGVPEVRYIEPNYRTRVA